MSDATVIIVDDDVSIREALEPLLEVAGWKVRSFGSAASFLDWEPPSGPTCLLLDVSLPGLNGLDLQAQISGERPEMPIIFISGFGDVPMTVQAMRAGAVEFLTKPFDDQVLLAAVERAIGSSKALIADQASVKTIAASYASLSKREREVMLLIVAGLLNKQVAGELGISEITVKAHRGRLMTKMKASTFADLVKMSERLGLDTSRRR